MITFLFFLILTFAEFVIVFLKWDNVNDLHEIGKFASDVTGVGEYYNKFADKVILFLKRFKPFMWIIAVVVLIFNLIIASFISAIISVIIGLITLFF